MFDSFDNGRCLLYVLIFNSFDNDRCLLQVICMFKFQLFVF